MNSLQITSPLEETGAPPLPEETPVRCELLGEDGSEASAALLGVNLEMSSFVSAAMLSDRLENSRFCSPADERTGLAHGWRPMGNNMGGMQCQLLRGMSLSGQESQLINGYTGPGAAFVQTGRTIFEGERLEVEIWAKVRHHPVTIEVGLRPLPSRAPAYCAVMLEIDAAYWKCYRATLEVPCNDHNAVFSIVLYTAGVVLFDQIHLRPQGIGHLDPRVCQQIGELALSTLRFPGGCMSTNYRWKLGTGPVHLRPSLPDPVFKWRADYEYGIDDYLSLCLQHGITPYLTANIGSATVEETGEWASYCTEWYAARGLSAPQIYFQMGNEQYGVWESSHMTGRMYVEMLKAFVPAIRENCPTALIIALAEAKAEGVSGAESTELRTVLLTEGRGLFDLVALNRYKGQWESDPETQMINAIESVDKIMSDMESLSAECRQYGIEPRMVLAEWGYWLHASHWDDQQFHEPDDAWHGFFVSGMFHAMARNAALGLEVATYTHLINAMALITNLHGVVSETAIGALFRIYRPAFPGSVLPLTLNSPCIAPGIAQVDLLVLRQPERIWVFAANRSLTKAARLDLPGLSGECQALLLSASRADLPLQPAVPLKDGEHWILPALSLLRLEFPADGAGG